MIIIFKFHKPLDNCWTCKKQGFFINCKEDVDVDFIIGECIFCKTKRFISAARLYNGEATYLECKQEIEDFIVSLF